MLIVTFLAAEVAHENLVDHELRKLVTYHAWQPEEIDPVKATVLEFSLPLLPVGDPH